MFNIGNNFNVLGRATQSPYGFYDIDDQQDRKFEPLPNNQQKGVLAMRAYVERTYHSTAFSTSSRKPSSGSWNKNTEAVNKSTVYHPGTSFTNVKDGIKNGGVPAKKVKFDKPIEDQQQSSETRFAAEELLWHNRVGHSCHLLPFENNLKMAYFLTPHPEKRIASAARRGSTSVVTRDHWQTRIALDVSIATPSDKSSASPTTVINILSRSSTNILACSTPVQ